MSFEDSDLIKELKENYNFILHPFDDRFFYHEKAENTLKEYFNILNLSGFGIDSKIIIDTAGALLSYVMQTQKTTLIHIDKLQQYSLKNYMYLDSSTIRNLELFNNIKAKRRIYTFFQCLIKQPRQVEKGSLENGCLLR